jgi:hypothetical protein
MPETVQNTVRFFSAACWQAPCDDACVAEILETADDKTATAPSGGRSAALTLLLAQ